MNALSSPDDDSSRPRRRPSSPYILSREQCLQGLSQLPSMLALDFFKPPKANAMRAVFNDILRHHAAESHAPAGALPAADAIELARRNPVVLNALESFLSDDQFDAVMEQIRGRDAADNDPDDGPADPEEPPTGGEADA